MNEEHIPDGRKKRNAARRLLLFREINDPSRKQLVRAKRVIDKAPGVEVVSEISGTLEISVEPGHEADLDQAVASLESWDLVEEGVAQMPSTPSFGEE